MKSALIVLSLVALGLAGHAEAQEPSGRIDLDVLSGPLGASAVIFRVGFLENDRDCPADRTASPHRCAVGAVPAGWVCGCRGPPRGHPVCDRRP